MEVHLGTSIRTSTSAEAPATLEIRTILASLRQEDRREVGMLSGTLGIDNPLNLLLYAEDASFNQYSKQHESACLPNTCVDLLHEIYNWANRQDERYIFWLNGLSGTGSRRPLALGCYYIYSVLCS
jgi:hypothetical protein